MHDGIFQMRDKAKWILRFGIFIVLCFGILVVGKRAPTRVTMPLPQGSTGTTTTSKCGQTKRGSHSYNQSVVDVLDCVSFFAGYKIVDFFFLVAKYTVSSAWPGGNESSETEHAGHPFGIYDSTDRICVIISSGPYVRRTHAMTFCVAIVVYDVELKEIEIDVLCGTQKMKCSESPFEREI